MRADDIERHGDVRFERGGDGDAGIGKGVDGGCGGRGAADGVALERFRDVADGAGGDRL
jgi:hypothetical protein